MTGQVWPGTQQGVQQRAALDLAFRSIGKENALMAQAQNITRSVNAPASYVNAATASAMR